MRAIRIGIVLYPGVQLSAAMGLTDLFYVAGQAAAEKGSPRLQVHDIQPNVPAEPAAGVPCDVLILPPSLQQPIQPDAAASLAHWLRERHGEGTVLASVCGGAFLLAETGLLKGRTVTTHWTYAQAFRDRFPDVVLDTDRLIIDGGDAGTSRMSFVAVTTFQPIGPPQCRHARFTASCTRSCRG